MATVVVAVVGFSVLGIGGGPEARLLPPPSSTSSTDPSPTTVAPDFSQIVLPAFPGETTTTAPISEGRSTIRGVVVGPEGGVPGAVVRIERLVGGVVQSRELATDENSGFIVQGVPGGRYRVRAYQAPLLTMIEPEIFYLEDGGDRELRLNTETFEGMTVRASTTPAAPIVGQAVSLAVRVAQRTVDPDGVGREVPAPNVPVRVRAPGWTETDDPVGITDADGVVVFQFSCDEVTNVTASATIGEEQETVPFDVPPCAPVPTTTTSTTEPGDDAATTSTSDPDDG